MANDGKIYITISDKRFGQNQPDVIPTPETSKEKEKSDPLGDYITHRFFNLIESQAKQAVKFTLGNIGNFTGDYIAQEHVNNALEAVSFIENVGIAALAGAKFGPVGALVGAGIAVAGTASSKAINLFTGYLDNIRQNKAIEQLRTRAGLNSNNNDSRGTEY